MTSATISTLDSPSASGHRLTAQQLGALVGYTVREARNKWTLVALFVLTTLFLAGLATVISVDVVEGTIALAGLFGPIPLQIGGNQISIADAVTVIQVGIVSLLSTFGLVLSLFVTGNIIPRTLNTGWVDLLASQPVARATLVLGRALGALTVITLALAYLFGGSWLLLTWKTGFGNAGFLLAGLVVLFTFACCYAGMVLVGILTGSSPVSIIAGIGIWILGLILYPLHTYSEWTTVVWAGWPRSLASGITETLYWALPKTLELTYRAAQATRLEPISLAPLWASLPFPLICMALACWWFARQDY
jgi:ABC-type transport system involved in multi-copper enzyme maturation permease subunit